MPRAGKWREELEAPGLEQNYVRELVSAITLPYWRHPKPRKMLRGNPLRRFLAVIF